MNRNILIVGGSSGIGLACARQFLRAGDRVANISRTPCEVDGVLNFPADVTHRAALEGALERLAESFDRLDVLVYCAGTSMAAPVEHVLERDFVYLFDVNVLGALRTLRLAVPLLRRAGGKVFLASSVGNVFPILYDGYYAASKAALENVGRELRMELKPYGVTVTNMRIGGTRTDFTFKRKVYPPESCGDYAPSLAVATETLAGIEQSGLMPEFVARRIHALSLRKSPPYHSTPGFLNKLTMVLERILPERVLMALVRRMQQ